MARKTGPTDCQLAFLDPLLCRLSLVIAFFINVPDASDPIPT
jgi:hypothetical protein